MSVQLPGNREDTAQHQLQALDAYRISLHPILLADVHGLERVSALVDIGGDVHDLHTAAGGELAEERTGIAEQQRTVFVQGEHDRLVPQDGGSEMRIYLCNLCRTRRINDEECMCRISKNVHIDCFRDNPSSMYMELGLSLKQSAWKRF